MKAKSRKFRKISKTYVWVNMEFFRKTITGKIVKIERTSAESRFHQKSIPDGLSLIPEQMDEAVKAIKEKLK